MGNDTTDIAYFLRSTQPSDLAGAGIYEDGIAPLIFNSHLPKGCVLAIWEK